MAQRAQRARQTQPTQKIHSPQSMPQPALYKHAAHPHVPRSANERHDEERAQRASQSPWAAFNERLAVWLTTHIGTMMTAYLFAGIGIGSLVGVFTGNVFLAALFGSISSYFLQLVLLPVLSVGQNVLSRKQELQSDEGFKGTLRILHENGEMMRHLEAQDRELIRQTGLLLALTGSAQPAAPAAPTPAPLPERPSHDRTDQHDTHDQPKRPRRDAALRGPVGGRGQLERLRPGS